MTKTSINQERTTKGIDDVVKELDDIKRILILALIKQGLKSKDIACVLGVNPSTITRIVPSRSIKK